MSRSRPTPAQARLLRAMEAAAASGHEPTLRVTVYHSRRASVYLDTPTRGDHGLPRIIPPATVVRCVQSGWLVVKEDPDPLRDYGISATRYELSEAGRKMLASLAPAAFVSKPNPKAAMRASQIHAALELRHAKGWLYLREVVGVDGLALGLYHSTGHPVIAYEIKVSRSDFLREKRNPAKNIRARTHADSFFYVAPAGIIKRDELPEGVGLIEVSENGRARIKVRVSTPQPAPTINRRLAVALTYATRRKIRDEMKARVGSALKQAEAVLSKIRSRQDVPREETFAAMQQIWMAQGALNAMES